MGVTSVGSDTQTATGSEDTLDTETGAGVYILVVDTSNMALGDSIVIRIKTKNQSGSSSVLAYENYFNNVQSEINKYSPAIPIDTELVCTLEQTGGTNRDYDWNLLKIS